jgi:AcrR family transcriptional regulator
MAAENTRLKLLEAAIEVLSVAGLESVTMRDVERAARVNRGLAAYHFGTREELQKAAVDKLMLEFHEEFERAQSLLREVSLEERARVLYRVYVRFVARRPQFARLLLAQGSHDTERTRWLADYLAKDYHFFARITERSIADPVQSAIDYFLAIGASSAIFAASSLVRDLFDVDVFTPEFVERFAGTVADLLTNTVAKAGSNERPGPLNRRAPVVGEVTS